MYQKVNKGMCCFAWKFLLFFSDVVDPGESEEVHIVTLRLFLGDLSVLSYL